MSDEYTEDAALLAVPRGDYRRLWPNPIEDRCDRLSEDATAGDPDAALYVVVAADQMRYSSTNSR